MSRPRPRDHRQSSTREGAAPRTAGPAYSANEIDDARRALDRLVFVSDGVFAIAMTLLIVGIALPEVTAGASPADLATRLWELRPKFLSYILSFLVISSYWISHQRMFQYIVRSDVVLVWLNIVFLLFVAFQPFPTSVLGNYPDEPTAVAFYAGTLAATGAVVLVLWVYATTHHHLVRADLSPRIIQQVTLRALSVPVIFVASAFIARTNPTAAEFTWLGIALFNFVVRWIYRDPR